VIAGAAVQQEIWSEDLLRAALKESLAQGLPASQIASQLAARSGWPRREIYRLITEMG
jgi:hypothetical protein